MDILVVAVTAKHSIPVHELLGTPTEDQPRQTALYNNLNEQAAERKVVSFCHCVWDRQVKKIYHTNTRI